MSPRFDVSETPENPTPIFIYLSLAQNTEIADKLEI